jgi:hypothetical protein
MNPFPFLPNWDKGITMSYSYDTVISTSEKGTEQRSPMRNYPYRKESFSLLDNSIIPNVLIYLKTFKDSYLDLPIFTEQTLITDAGNLNGLSRLNTSDTSFMYNAYSVENIIDMVLVTTTFVAPGPLFIIDLKTGLYQFIAAPYNNKHALKYFDFYPALNTNLMGETTVMFPTFKARFLEPSQSDETDKTSELVLNFEEFI